MSTKTKKMSERRKHAAAILHQQQVEHIHVQVEHAKELATRVDAVMLVGYNVAVNVHDPSQMVLLDLMEQTRLIRAKLENLAAILEGQLIGLPS